MDFDNFFPPLSSSSLSFSPFPLSAHALSFITSRLMTGRCILRSSSYCWSPGSSTPEQPPAKANATTLGAVGVVFALSDLPDLSDDDHRLAFSPPPQRLRRCLVHAGRQGPHGGLDGLVARAGPRRVARGAFGIERERRRAPIRRSSSFFIFILTLSTSSLSLFPPPPFFFLLQPFVLTFLRPTAPRSRRSSSARSSARGDPWTSPSPRPT